MRASEKLKITLVEAANHALTVNTHSSYQSALKMWTTCTLETGISGSFPVKEQEVMIFTAWLLSRGVCGATINCYLSGLRTAQLAAGINPPPMRTEILKTVLTGQNNLDNYKKRTGLTRTRAPVTPTILRLLKAELKRSKLCRHDQLLLWSVCTLMFFGGFRCHELLSKASSFFDPAYTLLGEDVLMAPVVINDVEINTIQIKLKCEKTNKSAESSIVDIYASGNDLCAVKAYQKFIAVASPVPKKPAFMLQNRKPLTGRALNSYIKEFLGTHLDTEARFFSSHSFRAGLASMIGNLGFTENQIKDAGRWSSEAYTRYLKLPRTRRIHMAKELSTLNI